MKKSLLMVSLFALVASCFVGWGCSSAEPENKEKPVDPATLKPPADLPAAAGGKGRGQ